MSRATSAPGPLDVSRWAATLALVLVLASAPCCDDATSGATSVPLDDADAPGQSDLSGLTDGGAEAATGDGAELDSAQDGAAGDGTGPDAAADAKPDLGDVAVDGGGQADAAPDAAADGVVDAPDPGVDAAHDVPTGCDLVSLRDEPATTLELMDPVPPNGERSFRVRVTHIVDCNEHPAMPRVVVHPDQLVVDIVARVWSEPILCMGASFAHDRLVTLRLHQPGSWTILDASAGGTATLTVDVDPGPPSPCGSQPAGSCLMDCDCAAPERCLSAAGLDGPFMACAEPCEDDFDCASGRCTSVDDGFELVCNSQLAACDAATPCPPGTTCDGTDCQPDYQLNQATRKQCLCDAECEPPLRCVQPDKAGVHPRCELMCRTAAGMSSPMPMASKRWCGPMHLCAEATQDASGLAVTDSVCGWLGE